ncbi:threonine dehydratase [Hyaloraphidium curvatum]|nr:threonine dehydratase [Hyaloraphidium curvatum]
MEEQLHIRTPLVRSAFLSRQLGCTALLKLESLQPPGSFKARGVGLVCRRAFNRGARNFVIASGGNAGLAAAHAAHVLGARCTVVLPETTSEKVKKLLEARDAEVVVFGSAWDLAAQHAKDLAAADPSAFLLHPFEGADLWEGHSSLVLELADDLPAPPTAIVCSVGGGGLLAGILLGLSRAGRGWDAVPVIAAETVGADSFRHALSVGRAAPLQGGITSVATSLGAITASQGAVDAARAHPGKVISAAVSDAEAVAALAAFADAERMLVEPACSAGLALALGDRRLKSLLPNLDSTSTVVFVVCGGAGVDLAAISKWTDLDEGDGIFISAGGVVMDMSSNRDVSGEGEKLLEGVERLGRRVMGLKRVDP